MQRLMPIESSQVQCITLMVECALLLNYQQACKSYLPVNA